MQYLLLIYDDEKRWTNMTEAQMQSGMAAYGAFGEEFAGKIKGGNALQPTHTATTVRTRDGKRLTTDGPYVETKEALGGYYLIDAKRSRRGHRHRRKDSGCAHRRHRGSSDHDVRLIAIMQRS